ncbi:hypothetical protein [Paludisphaera mucosa]|uniref:DUF4159 domain-containing protein n=1 Tax=Paludisphaera mucosa TaxID=3030827 RepID=A0ABT6FKK8_9BACT|nr:hypothetical protein [Paludisphaera mucosa]MDG3008100.1 hypothetical protein [Paludisphaera mucosa]
MRGVFVTFVGLIVGMSARSQEPPAYQLWAFGDAPHPAFKDLLLEMPAVQEELELTPAQKRALEETRTRLMAKARQAIRGTTDRQKMQAAREAVLKELMPALLAKLEPGQRERLDQIQLQSQGPFAFGGSRNLRLDLGGPSVAARLKLGDDQIERVKAIDGEGESEIARAAAVPIVLDPKAGAPTLESIRKLVEASEFQAVKRKARADARKAWASAIERIEQVLTEDQRKAYREMLGAAFDLSKMRSSDDEAEEDVQMVAAVLNIGGGGGQRADPDFDAKVARPAYTTTHPRVLFDEAHDNFHTADGRYRPFAQLIASDGYAVIPNKEKFSQGLLAKGDVLIIANALGAAGMGAPGASDSAFTAAECDAVRDWVRAGGSLLLVTDHAPFGSAAESLAGRFGVDMSKGYTSDPRNSEGGETSLVFTRENHLLGDHPITSGRDDSERIRRIQTFTGQSLKGPAGGVAILKLGETATDEGPDGKPASAAGRAQGMAFAFGEGRVVVMGEAAELSAQLVGAEKFGMNVPGLDNRQMALNIMHWLSGLLEPRAAARKAE